ncbi:P-loop containing nucleoside triphosphate hydrolase protein [Coprinopsis sp. MPI-PUGE-AT-0042]|nr:P-loop containing nucleoside triphosphate hydrolase protein [Coprinopsis sp. MPI-PUGE-AT-0042]
MTPVFNTPEGHARIREILAKHEPPIIPHDYQCKGIAVSLDGHNLMATMATGAGKTGFYSFLMIVMKAIAQDPSLALQGFSAPRNPLLLLVIPTKALQEDMKRSMSQLGLKVVIINRDKRLRTLKDKIDIWKQCIDDCDVILLSPEQLAEPEFEHLMKNPIFASCICYFGVDEVHLINSWGRTFRLAFNQLGFVRVRLPTQGVKFIPLIATSVTIREGEPKRRICSVLGLEEGRYHLLRRSNMRYDIQIIFREMVSGIGSTSFPELDWVLEREENTVIFCKTITLGFRVVAYLWKLAMMKGVRDLPKKVRLFNSANWPSYNSETLGFLNDNPSANVTVATDILSVGWDSQDTTNAIILGEPSDIDEFMQKGGRVGRNRDLVGAPRLYLYYTKGAKATAEQVLEHQDAPVEIDSNHPDTSSSTSTMDASMAELLLSKCYPSDIDRQYHNPPTDIPCHCPRCKKHPPAQKPAQCNCSGCIVEDLSLSQTTRPTASGPQKERAKRGEGITKEMRSAAEDKLKLFRLDLYLKTTQGSMLPPNTLILDSTFSMLIDNLYKISSNGDIVTFVPDVPDGITRNALNEQSFAICNELKATFTGMRATKASARKPSAATDNSTSNIVPDVRIIEDNSGIADNRNVVIEISEEGSPESGTHQVHIPIEPSRDTS